MKKSVWFSIVALLELAAFEVGLFTYLTLRRTDVATPSHTLILTLLLMVIALITGTIASNQKWRSAPWIVLVLGCISLAIGFFFLRELNYHERAGAALGIGIIGIVGGIAGLLAPHSLFLKSIGLMALSSATSVLGLLMIARRYQGRAYMVLITGLLLFVISLAWMAFARYRSRNAGQSLPSPQPSVTARPDEGVAAARSTRQSPR